MENTLSLVSDRDGSLSDPKAIALKRCKELGLDPNQTISTTMLDLMAGQIALWQQVSQPPTTPSQKPPPTLVGALSLAKQAHDAILNPWTHAIQECVQNHKVLERGPIPAFELFSLDRISTNVKALKTAFHEPHFLHSFAVKANSTPGILLHLLSLGMGAECASIGEMLHSINLGFPADMVVLDSAAKTHKDIQDAIKTRCYINLDNLEEVNRIAQLIQNNHDNNDFPKLEQHGTSRISLRINPLVGGGTIAATSTVTATSKFGVPLDSESEEQLFTLFEKNPWLQGVHVHAGSQGVHPSIAVRACRILVDFSKRTNARLGRNQIVTIDIGGGLPVNYHSDLPNFTFDVYSKMLRADVPELFSGDFKIITEFGRSVIGKCGVSISRVEAVKPMKKGPPIVVLHLGANQFIREVYNPEHWYHRVSVLSGDGSLKDNSFEVVPYQLAGPLCFAGDLIGGHTYLPQIETGDLVVIHDTGGYTSSMFSYFNSRPCLGGYAFVLKGGDHDDGAKNVQVSVVTEPHTHESTIAFWGTQGMRPLG